MPDNETPIRTAKRSLHLQIYDNFDKPDYSLTDYAEKWITPYGLGEMAARHPQLQRRMPESERGPFQTAYDVGVNDHLKYEAVSAQPFPVPENGTLVLSSDIKAATPGTVPGLIQHGSTAPRDPGLIRPAHPRRRGTAHDCCKDSRLRW